MIFQGFRTDLDDYFKLSGIRESKKLNHHPFVVLYEGITEIVYSVKDLLENHPAEADVISQWGGEWRSDFFHFKVSDLIKHIELNPKKDYHVI